jgi:hypothetical protein
MSALTKMLIVLQLVFALVCSTLLVLMVSKQQDYKAKFDQAQTGNIALNAIVADKDRQLAAQGTQLENINKLLTAANNDARQANANRTQSQAAADAKTAELGSQVATLQSSVTSLSAANTTLTSQVQNLNDELSKTRPQVAALTRQNSELTRALNEKTNSLAAAEQAIAKLQEQLAQNKTPSGAVAPMGSEGQITSLAPAAAAPAAKVNAEISEVREVTGRPTIGLQVGTRDGIRANTKLVIYRGNSYIGDAVVQQATPEESVAVVVSTKPGATVQKGDLVSTVNQ